MQWNMPVTNSPCMAMLDSNSEPTLTDERLTEIVTEIRTADVNGTMGPGDIAKQIGELVPAAQRKAFVWLYERL